MDGYVAFTDEVQQKAETLSVTPKLLLFSLFALSENLNATEEYIFKPYYQSISNDMKEAAKRQIKSKNKNTSEAGIVALASVNKRIEGVAEIDEVSKQKLAYLLPEGEDVLYLHSVALNSLTNELNTIKQTYSKQVDCLDVVQIIRVICPELIEKAKEFIEIFKANDIHYN